MKQQGRLLGAVSALRMPSGRWWDILRGLMVDLRHDRISIVAAGVAYYGLLALFPGLAAVVSIYGLMADPRDLEQQLSLAGAVLPAAARDVLRSELSQIVSGSPRALGLGFAAALGLMLWSAAYGVKALITALNIVYGEREKRGVLRLNAVALLLTLGAVVAVITALALVVALPALLSAIRLPVQSVSALSITRWFVLAIGALIGLAVLYRFGPSRRDAKWQWVSAGAVVATLLWLVASGLFSFYVSNFGGYNRTYGSLAAVVILLVWLFLTAYSMLLGAELNTGIARYRQGGYQRGNGIDGP